MSIGEWASASVWQVRLAKLYDRVAGQAPTRSLPDLPIDGRWLDGGRTGLPSRDLRRLILDGVLEMDSASGPRTGIAAARLLAESWKVPEPVGELAARSALAVRLAQSFGDASSVEHARWLYSFGRKPPVLAELRAGGHRGSLLRSHDRLLLERLYSCHAGSDWEVWSRHSEDPDGVPRDKLYISPSDRDLDAVVHEAVRLLCQEPVAAFKLVPNRREAARPDKFIVYFHTLEELRRWRAELAAEIAGCDGHGVAFTCQQGDHTALSRAVDPPAQPGGKKTESWRSWCVERLGWSLVVARLSSTRGSTDELPPWQFALLRLTFEGVDVARWCRTRESRAGGMTV